VTNYSHAQLTPMTVAAVDELLRQTGHTLTVLDIDDILILNAACEKYLHPGSSSDVRMFAGPVQCGSVTLYPLTYSASAWLDERGFDWCGDSDDPLADMVLLYALSLSNKAQALWAIEGKVELRRCLKRFRRRLHATPVEVDWAIKQVVQLSYGSTGDNNERNYGSVIAALLREFGSSPDFWMFEATLPLIDSLTRELIRSQCAENDRMRRHHGRGGKGRKTQAIPLDPYRASVYREYLQILRNMRERWADGA